MEELDLSKHNTQFEFLFFPLDTHTRSLKVRQQMLCFLSQSKATDEYCNIVPCFHILRVEFYVDYNVYCVPLMFLCIFVCSDCFLCKCTSLPCKIRMSHLCTHVQTYCTCTCIFLPHVYHHIHRPIFTYIQRHYIQRVTN